MLDYDETFSPTILITTVCTLMAANKSWPIFQVDVNNTFLRGDLKEIVYMCVLDRFNARKAFVCRLCHSLCGFNRPPELGLKNFAKLLSV